MPGRPAQSTFTTLAKCASGLGSKPTPRMPSFLHSTSVVPVPQNGSSTVCSGPRPNVPHNRAPSGRKRQHESIPVVKRTIVRLHPVALGANRSARPGRCQNHDISTPIGLWSGDRQRSSSDGLAGRSLFRATQPGPATRPESNGTYFPVQIESRDVPQSGLRSRSAPCNRLVWQARVYTEASASFEPDGCGPLVCRYPEARHTSLLGAAPR